MGDRNSIVLHFNPMQQVRAGKLQDQTIWIYGHWAGNGMLPRSAQGIEVAKPRWGDASYAARAIIQTVIPPIEEGARDILGWGVAPYQCDHDFGNSLVHIWLEDNLVTVDKADAQIVFNFEEWVSKFNTDSEVL